MSQKILFNFLNRLKPRYDFHQNFFCKIRSIFFINNYQFSVDTVAGGSGDQSIRVPTRDRETHGRPDRNTKGT